MKCKHCGHTLRTSSKFKHGSLVLFKELRRGRTRKAGRIVSYPRGGSQIANVVWPDGWAGWCRLDELRVWLR